MSDEREVTIRITAKNLSQEEFDKARKALVGVRTAADDTSKGGSKLKEFFLGAGGAADTAKTSLLGLASGFALGSIITSAGTALVGFISNAVETAGALVDLKNATGVSIKTLQQWDHVADQGGIKLENLTNAAFKLSVALASGDKSTRAGVEALGLSWQELQNLKPEDQLDRVLRAAEATGSETDRNAALVQIFGDKGAIALAKIVSGYTETKAAAKASGDAQVEAIDRASDAWSKFKKDFSTGFTQALGNIVLGFTETGVAVESLSAKERQHYEVLRKTGGEHLYLIQLAHARAEAEKNVHENVEQGAGRSAVAQRDYAGELAKTLEKIRDMEPETRKQIVAASELEGVTQALTDQFGLNANELRILIQREKEAEDASRRHTEAQKKAREESTVLGDGLSETGNRLHALGIIINEDYIDKLESSVDWTAEIIEQLQRLKGEVITIGPALQTIPNAAQIWQPFTKGVVSMMPEKATWKDKWDELGLGLQDTLAGIPMTLARAFEGGGDIMGAVKSIASQVGSKLGAGLGALIGGPIGKAIGGALGSIGGSFIVGLFTDKNAAEVRKYNSEIEKVRQSLIDTYGPLDQLELKAQAVGLSFRDNWGHQGKAGLDAMNGLAAEFKRRWDDVNDSLATSRSELDALLKRGADLGYEFNASGDLVKVSTEKMREVAQKYGLDLQALGPAFDQAGLNERITDVINAFELMDKGGTTTGTILSGMKDEINAIVNDSIKFKTKIPENMRPWIQNLIDTGQLIDANGDKITDMAAIQFGEPVQTEFEQIRSSILTLIESIQTLVDRIGGIAAAANSIPQVPAPWEHWGDPPAFAGVGGGWGEPGFARGTYGTLGHDFPDFGDGTRVVLHNREAVTPYEDRISTALRWLGASGGQVTGGASPVTVNLLVERQGVRLMTDEEYILATVQGGLDQSRISVPERNISQRSGRG